MESNPARSASYSKLNDYNNPNNVKTPLTARQSSLAKWKCIFVGLVIISCIIFIGLGIGFGLAKIHDKKPARLFTLNDHFVSVYKKGAVSSQSPQCSQVGRDILLKGGSAVDAAIAALLCEGAYSPQSAGLGGGFLMTVFNQSTGKVLVIDARETAPAKATEDMYADEKNATRFGGLAVAVPGELRGYQLAHAHYGRLEWSELFEPAIRICREGVLISEYVASVLKIRAREEILREPSMRSVYVNNETGNVLEEGDVVYLFELANTLEIIAKKGADELYVGQLATDLIKDLKEFGSLISLSDLKNYEAVIRKPTEFLLDNGSILYSVPPPGSGLILGLLMGILQKFDYSKMSMDDLDSTVTFYHRFVEACKYAYAKRGEIGDPDFENMLNLTNLLESPELATKIFHAIDDNRTFGAKDYDAIFNFANDHGTAHVSVLAPNGDAVSATSTLNTWFGAIIRSSSTGIILNNEMDDFSVMNRANAYGLPPSPVNFIKAGKRPASSMTPSIVLNKDGNVSYTFGGSGGSKIISATAYVYMLHNYLNKSLEESLYSPRLHHQLFPNCIQAEALISQDIRKGLEQLGHDVIDMDNLAAVHLIYRDRNGTVFAGADNRRKGAPAGF